MKISIRYPTHKNIGLPVYWKAGFILFCYERIVGAAPAFVILTEDALGHEVVDIVQRCVRGAFPDLSPLAVSEFVKEAVELIKTAILQSQYNAIRIANQEQLILHFGIGRYISENSRTGYWGTGALEIISNQLKNDLSGLMGFGVTSLKNMRKFYEAWASLEDKSATAVAGLCILSWLKRCSDRYLPPFMSIGSININKNR